MKFIMNMQETFLEKLKTWVKIDGYFIFLWLVFSGTFIFILSSQSVVYRSEMILLVIPKNEKISVASEEIAGNLTEMVGSLFFYEKLLRDNPSIEDEWADFSKDKKKKLWNEKVEAFHQAGSTTFVIEITDKSQAQSNFLAKQSVGSLFNLAGRYYNIKTDIDLRILEGPITKMILRGWYWIILVGILVGAFFSWLVQLFFLFVEKLFSAKSKSNFSLIKFPKIKNTSGGKKEDLEKLIENYAEKDNAFFAPKIKTGFRKSNPPINLPIASTIEERDIQEEEDDILADKQEIEIPAIKEEQIRLEQIKKENTNEVVPEPTEEEFKKRLNQLLRGDL